MGQSSWGRASSGTGERSGARSLPEVESSCFRGSTPNSLKMDIPLSDTVTDAGTLSSVPEHPVQGESSRVIVAKRSSYPNPHHVAPHWHARAQFVFAVEGTMTVRTPRRAWMVPPSRALWVPAHTVHEIQMYGVVEMRSLYVNHTA